MSMSGPREYRANPAYGDPDGSLLDELLKVRSSIGGADETGDGGAAEAELEPAVARLERLTEALAALLATEAGDNHRSSLEALADAFADDEVEAQALLFLKDVWAAADEALGSVTSVGQRISEQAARDPDPDWLRRLELVGRSAKDISAGLSQFLLDRSASVGADRIEPVAEQADPIVSSSGPTGAVGPPGMVTSPDPVTPAKTVSGPPPPMMEGVSKFVASLLDLVDRIAAVARSVTEKVESERARLAQVVPLAAPAVGAFAIPPPGSPVEAGILGDVPDFPQRELVLDPIVPRGELPFDQKVAGQPVANTSGARKFWGGKAAAGKSVPGAWVSPRSGRDGSLRSRTPVLAALAFIVLGASAIGVLILGGGGGWQRLLGAVGLPSTTPGAHGSRDPSSAPVASGSVAPGGESPAPGSPVPGTTPSASGGSGTTPKPGLTPGPGTPTPAPTVPPPPPPPPPTPTPTLDPAAAAQQFASRISAGSTSVGGLLDSISAALGTSDWAAISSAASSLAGLADSEAAWLGLHPPAACFAPEHGDAVLAYADIRNVADSIAAAAAAQYLPAINPQLAVGRQDKKDLDRAASGAPIGC